VRATPSASPRSSRISKGEQLYLKACTAKIGYLFVLAFPRCCRAPLPPLTHLRSAFCAQRFFPFRILAIHPPQSQQPPPCLRFIIPIVFSARASLTWCAASWVGPRRSSSGRSGQARAPSMTWSRGSSSSSTRTSTAGWCRQSPPSSSYSWRSSAFRSSTSPPLRPPRGRLHPFHGDVRGRSSLHRYLQAFLCPGWDREEQVRDWRLLLPAPSRDVRLLHQRLLQCQVGGLP
jgi:hypothetical protein